jgi:hypothetical protein
MMPADLKSIELKHVTGERRALLERMVSKSGDQPVLFNVFARFVDSLVGGIQKTGTASKDRDDTILALVEQLERRCATLEARIVQLEGR